MYHKVTDKNIPLITYGTLLIKYPATDEPVNEFNDSDKKRIIQYRVDSVEHGIITATPQKLFSAEYNFDTSPLKKSGERLIEESRWWLDY